MARVLKGSQFYLHTQCTSANGMNHTCLAFPAEAGTHLPTPEGWKAELATTDSKRPCGVVSVNQSCWWWPSTSTFRW